MPVIPHTPSSEHEDTHSDRSWSSLFPPTVLDDCQIPLPDFSVIQPSVRCAAFDALFPDPGSFLRISSAYILSVLQSAKDPPFIHVQFALSSEPGGIARTRGNTVTLHTSYVESYASTHTPEQALREIAGIITHELVHVFQHDANGGLPGGLGEGIADFIRLLAGLAPPHWKKTRGGQWDQGYQCTAYFLDWLENRRPGFVLALNARVKDKWDKTIFEELAGKDVETLWLEHQEKLPALDYEIEKSASPEKRPSVPVPASWTSSQSPSWKEFLVTSPIPLPAMPSFSYTPPTTPCPTFAFILPDPIPFLRAASSFIFFLLQSAKDPPFEHVALVLSSEPGGIAYTNGNTITLFASYVEASAATHKPEETLNEIAGVLTHELVHVYQHDGHGTVPGGLIEGIADWVRLHAALAPPHWTRTVGGKWDAGYERTAYFLDWVDGSRPGFVRELNWRAKEKYDPAVFKDLTGEEVDELWQVYQVVLGSEKVDGRKRSTLGHIFKRLWCSG